MTNTLSYQDEPVCPIEYRTEVWEEWDGTILDTWTVVKIQFTDGNTTWVSTDHDDLTIR